MCYNPITIINPSKYVSLRTRERFLLQVPCGHCAQCATNKSNEWYFRSYHETLDTLNASESSYILFDTLTYRNACLPHLSDFVTVPRGCDYPCFSKRDLQLFNKRLRKRLNKYHCSYTYFITSEYGTDDKHTHRPHYHLLLYCRDGKIDSLSMSRLIAESWTLGRTDGLPYKSAYYVRKNTFHHNNFADSLRTCRYVSKYVQKSCMFTKEINRRLDSIMQSIANKMIDGWIDTVHAKRVRQRYARLVGQFHLQSKNFGASYLQDIDVTDFTAVNNTFMPDDNKVHLRLSLPQYYKRKMYYEVKKIDGNDTWIPTKLGLQYLQYRDNQLLKDLENRFIAANHQIKKSYDAKKLSDYVLNYRGRIRAVNLPSNPLDKYEHPSLFCYVTPSDREHLDKLGLSVRFVGNNTIGYRASKLPARIRFKDFIDRYVIIDNNYEQQLKELYEGFTRVNDKRQEAYERKQHLVNLYHHLGFL